MAKKGESTTNLSAQSFAAVDDKTPSAEDHETIAQLAYSYWQARGRPIGSPEEDWYRAENELHQLTAAVAG